MLKHGVSTEQQWLLHMQSYECMVDWLCRWKRHSVHAILVREKPLPCKQPMAYSTAKLYVQSRVALQQKHGLLELSNR